MALSDIVNVVVTTANPGITAQGFGIPMILAPASWGPELTRTYNSIGAVGPGDAAITDAAYMAASKFFAQSPSVPTIMWGRQALPATQQLAIGVKAATVGAIYKIRLAMPSAGAWVSQTASYTALGAAAWVLSTAYVKGALVTNDTGKLYTCITAGTSAGAGGPTGTAADITDGTVHWQYAGAGIAGVTSNDAVLNGIKSAIEALAAPVLAGVGAAQMTSSFQGSAGSRTMRLLANTAGNFYGAEVLNRALLTLAQDHGDPGVATDLAAILLESSVWYGLITVCNSTAVLLAAAAWVESNKRLYGADSLDTEIPQHALSGGTDIFVQLKNLSYARTHGFYHPANDEFAAAAEMGKFFPINPGGDNWRLKTLAGVSVKGYTDTEQTNIVAKYANYYAQLGASGGSTNVIQGDGKVFANEYVDVVRFIDWYVANLQADLVNLLIQNNKIAYTDLGVSQLENVLRFRNKAGIDAGGIAADPAPVIIAQKVSAQSTADKQARVYNGLSTNWEEAGAINKMRVNVAVAA